MKNAIVNLIASEGAAGKPLILHILKKPGTDSTSLKNALETFKDDLGLSDRLEILIEAYDIGPL